jgi:hypothetical protein
MSSRLPRHHLGYADVGRELSGHGPYCRTLYIGSPKPAASSPVCSMGPGRRRPPRRRTGRGGHRGMASGELAGDKSAMVARGLTGLQTRPDKPEAPSDNLGPARIHPGGVPLCPLPRPGLDRRTDRGQTRLAAPDGLSHPCAPRTQGRAEGHAERDYAGGGVGGGRPGDADMDWADTSDWPVGDTGPRIEPRSGCRGQRDAVAVGDGAEPVVGLFGDGPDCWCPSRSLIASQ